MLKLTKKRVDFWSKKPPNFPIFRKFPKFDIFSQIFAKFRRFWYFLKSDLPAVSWSFPRKNPPNFRNFPKFPGIFLDFPRFLMDQNSDFRSVTTCLPPGKPPDFTGIFGKFSGKKFVTSGIFREFSCNSPNFPYRFPL